ncbi:hypothetical protein J3P88_07825 [Pseudomonas sp. Z3-6]|uniref:hypothetical protein n=1 Tax=Pseudomonas sp. Z3-6 TaxID=2817411 RepID=UPI003DA8A9AF
MKKLSDLHEVFLSFKAEKAEGTSIVFINKGLKFNLTEEEILSKYSYVVGCRGIGGGKTRHEKEFYAERYGGDGILRNGGGGRCGFDGDYQLKGIGPNNLVGANSDEAHGNGLLSLETAVYESIWAEIINIALPYGAMRTVAIISMGTEFNQDGKTYARGLLVREAAVRPAHFIRAPYFNDISPDSLCSDARRVKLAVQRLIEFLPAGPDGELVSNLGFGLVELAKRYARQFAAARAKRIIHYNVSASNVSLNGAWLDLSGTRIFSQLITGDKLDIDRFVGEYIPALDSIRCLCYGLCKYSVVSAEDADMVWMDVLLQFEAEYELRFGYYLALQAGFCSRLLDDCIGSSCFLEFSRALKNVLLLDEFSMSLVAEGVVKGGYEFWGKDLYLSLLLGKVSKLVNGTFGIWIDSLRLERLSLAYSSLFDLILERALLNKIGRVGVIRGMAINLVRLNRSDNLLLDLKDHIFSALSNVKKTSSSAELDRLVEEVVQVASINYANEGSFVVPLWESEPVKIGYDIERDCFIVKPKGKESSVVRGLSEVVSVSGEIEKAKNYYEPVWDYFMKETFDLYTDYESQ